MTPPTEEELAEIEKRANAATKGPWGPIERGLNAVDIACVEGAIASIARWFWGKPGSASENLANAAFIAHARTDIPRLLAEVRRLREENKRLGAHLEDHACTLETSEMPCGK